MATYKVIQDIEAEDKFVGPLTLKQFVFAMSGTFFGYLSFFAVAKGATWALLIFFPPTFFGFFMAIPWSKEQPTDVWVLAKIRFRFKSKVRIWNQAGMQELVTITAPKKVEKILINNLSQTEVTSRLKALAETIDTRGWAVKNAGLQMSYTDTTDDDRLIDPAGFPQEVPEMDLESIPDMMDSTSMDHMIDEQNGIRKSQLTNKINRIREGEALEDIRQPEVMITPPSEQATPLVQNEPDEQALIRQLKAKIAAGDIANDRLSSITLQPVSTQATQPAQQLDPQVGEPDDEIDNKITEVEKAQASMTEQVSPDILNLARNNDLNVATIARQAENSKRGSSDEVVISLH